MGWALYDKTVYPDQLTKEPTTRACVVAILENITSSCHNAGKRYDCYTVLMSYNDEQLRELASWLPGFRELEETENQITVLWKLLKDLRIRAKEIKGSLRDQCPLDLDDLEYRFWSKVRVTDEDDSCWEWTRSRGPAPDDYGQFRWTPPGATESEVMYASRVALFLTNGAVPAQGNHNCDNPPCCRPKHLYDGTHQDNMRDRMDRGRYVVQPRLLDQNGTKNRVAKLTDELVIQARDLAREGSTLPQTHAAIKSPASMTVLRWAITGRTWKHLDDICPPVVKAFSGSAIKGKTVAHRPPASRRLSDDDVRAIRRARAKDALSREGVVVLAERYGITAGMVSAIDHRRVYAHVTDQEEP